MADALVCSICNTVLHALRGLHAAGDPPVWRQRGGSIVRCPTCGQEQRLYPQRSKDTDEPKSAQSADDHPTVYKRRA